jgi:hypothetical protein
MTPVTPMHPQPVLDFALWRRRFVANADLAEQNSLMDSGWSAAIAEKCMFTACKLWRELVVALAQASTPAELDTVRETAQWPTAERPK